jgi:hypothetical protein
LIGNPHRQHTSSSITVSSPTSRWNVDVSGRHLSTSAARSDLSNWQSPMIAIWYRPSRCRYGSICALYGIFRRCAFKWRVLWGCKKYFIAYNMVKLIIKYIIFILYDKKYLHQFWSFATYVHFGVGQAVADTLFFTIIIWKNYKFGTILVELN